MSRTRTRTYGAILGAITATVVAAAAPAATQTIPRDGRWAGNEQDRRGEAEIATFKVRSRAVRELGFSIPLRCENSDTGQQTTTAFRGGKDDAAPAGRRIPRSGVLNLRWTESDAFREARINVEINFATRRPTITINFRTEGELESCQAFSVIRLRHSVR